MESPARAHFDTTYGTLLATCGNRRRIHIGTAAATEGISDSVVLSRVPYTLRLDLVRDDELGGSDGTSWSKRPADLACLEATEWALTNEAVIDALHRKEWTDYRKSGPSEAARRELRERLIPQIAEWLATPAANDLVVAGEAGQLGTVATQARRKADVLRAAADELAATADMAAQGDDLPDGLRQAVLYGYRLEGTWEPPKPMTT